MKIRNTESLKTLDKISPNRVARFLNDAQRVIEDLEQFGCRLIEFLDRITIRLLLYGVLVYHVGHVFFVK